MYLRKKPCRLLTSFPTSELLYYSASTTGVVVYMLYGTATYELKAMP